MSYSTKSTQRRCGNVHNTSYLAESLILVVNYTRARLGPFRHFPAAGLVGHGFRPLTPRWRPSRSGSGEITGIQMQFAVDQAKTDMMLRELISTIAR